MRKRQLSQIVRDLSYYLSQIRTIDEFHNSFLFNNVHYDDIFPSFYYWKRGQKLESVYGDYNLLHLEFDNFFNTLLKEDSSSIDFLILENDVINLYADWLNKKIIDVKKQIYYVYKEEKPAYKIAKEKFLQEKKSFKHLNKKYCKHPFDYYLEDKLRFEKFEKDDTSLFNFDILDIRDNPLEAFKNLFKYFMNNTTRKLILTSYSGRNYYLPYDALLKKMDMDLAELSLNEYKNILFVVNWHIPNLTKRLRALSTYISKKLHINNKFTIREKKMLSDFLKKSSKYITFIDKNLGKYFNGLHLQTNPFVLYKNFGGFKSKIDDIHKTLQEDKDLVYLIGLDVFHFYKP